MLRAQYETRRSVPQGVIRAVEFDAPPLRAGEALVRVVAAPINPSDLLTLTGEYGRLTLRGFWLARWVEEVPGDRRRALFGEIAGLVAAGRLTTPIHATYDLSEIEEAVAVAAGGGRSGKVLVVPRDRP